MTEATPSLTITRALQLLLAGIIALAFVGFVVGIRQGTTVPDLQPPERAPVAIHPDAVPATGYDDFDRRIHGPNRDWENVLTQLEQPALDWFAEPQRTEAARRAVLAERAERRAYDGAPPVVPHPIDQMSTSSCMACHGEGQYIGKGVYASKMSHDFYPNCTQCHVEQHVPDLDPFVLSENRFRAEPVSLGGDRAWPGAPPTVPHTTFMREDCLSCHGPTGAEPIRTTHPYQTNCLQCHAPSAVLDQLVEHDHVPWHDHAPTFLHNGRLPQAEGDDE